MHCLPGQTYRASQELSATPITKKELSYLLTGIHSLITGGSVNVSIGRKDLIAKAGESIIIPPNVLHSFTAS